VEPFPEDLQRGVAIVAHPDDLEYGGASAVARWTAEGKNISYVLVTRGEAGIDGMAPDQAGPAREAEQRRSAGVVGVDHVEFLGYPDGTIEYGLGLRRDLAGALRRLRPEIVVTMHFDLTWGTGGGINHADHRAVGIAALDACRDAANRWVFPELGAPWPGVRAVYVFGTSDASHFVDVTKTIDAGVRSLLEHEAYLRGLGGSFNADEFLRGTATVAGRDAGCQMAVLFRRLTV